MSLQFIMGPSGAGKSHYLYDYVTKESLKNPDKCYFVLVPEQATMQAQKDLVLASPRKGILNVEVLSFHRLAHRVFEELGENQKTILDDVGKNFVIRKVAGECEEELKILGSNLKRIGYITEIKSIISEFVQYDIQPKDLEELLDKSKQSPSLFYKLQDIKKVYENFQKYLAEKYITGEELLDYLSSMVGKSEILKDSVVVLDGFTGFTPIQNKLLRELLKICEKVLITVTMDQKENPFSYKHPYQLFGMSKQTVTGLVRIADECKVNVDKPVYLYENPVYRFRGSEALGFLESHLFRYSKESYDKEQNNIQIWCAKNPREEVGFVAQKIHELVRKENYRYRDVAVVTSDLSSYANYIERAFEAYHLPVFMDHKRSILLNSFVEYVRSLLAMAEQDFTYESVFRYLRTGLTEITNEDIDILENYVVALGIKGYKKWQEKWIRRTRDMDESALAQINQIREQFIDSIQEVMVVLKSKYKTVLDVTTALHSFFLQEELQKKVKDYQLRFETEGELALAKEYAQVYRIVIELLEQYVELLGEERISIQEYSELLDSGLEEAKVGIIPPSVDHVVVGDVERSRIKDVKVVFLLGANDIYIPGGADKSGLLSEYDRNQMTAAGALLAPDAKEKAYIQKFYLYLILTKPSNQVYLTYSKTSANGTALRPSHLITDILKLFPKAEIQEVQHTLSTSEMTEESGFELLIQGLQKKHEGLSTEWQELYAWYKRNPKWCQKIERLVEAAFYEREESKISKNTARRLYGEILGNSVTRLERFSACAYAHFLTYGLRLKEREEYQFRALDLGNLFHGAIEYFSKKVEQSDYTWNTLPEHIQEEFVKASVDACIVDYDNSILYSTARNEYVIQRLTRMVRRSIWALRKQLERGDFVPAGFEVSYGGGKIDRIDICEDEDRLYVKIVDYKTGEKALDLGELCYGLQMQLVVYMNAALEMQKQQHPDKIVIPAGIFYYRVKDPIVSKPDLGQNVDELILKELRPDGLVQADETVLAHLDRNFVGASYTIPVTRTQSGGISKASKVLSEDDFVTISKFAKKKVEQIKDRILGGDAQTMPYRLGEHTGCDYCPYHAVCGFEENIPGYQYQGLQTLDKEDALTVMRKEVDTWE